MQPSQNIMDWYSVVLLVGGGSTMGYKLAGYDVIGCNEIDPRMNAVYVQNHHPKHNFLCDIRELVKREELPEELFHLDILDGSPPCSSFAVCGNREKDWGKEKHFREGQNSQVLDTLFFDFIALAKRLQPKVIIAENVKGLLLGEAIHYVRRIYEDLDDAGYYAKHFLLDASKMGVPQKRERTFFVCIRKDIAEPFMIQDGLFDRTINIDMNFNEPPITCFDCQFEMGKEIKGCFDEDYQRMMKGEPKKYQQSQLVDIDKVHPTITAGYSEKASPMPKWSKHWLSVRDLCTVGTFPQDYDFGKEHAHYIIGMSVPPVMTAQVASRVYEQILSKL